MQTEAQHHRTRRGSRDASLRHSDLFGGVVIVRDAKLLAAPRLEWQANAMTLAGNLKDMFKNISEIGSDLEFRSSVASPTIRIDGLTVGGE